MAANACIVDRTVLISFQSIERLAGTTRRDHIRLAQKAIHLWGIELDGSCRCLARWMEWLDEVERSRAARLVREGDRQQYALAHGGLREVLSRYLEVSPDAVMLDRSAAGKPFVTGTLR